MVQSVDPTVTRGCLLQGSAGWCRELGGAGERTEDPAAFFTKAGMAGLRQLLLDRRAIDSARIAHRRFSVVEITQQAYAKRGRRWASPPWGWRVEIRASCNCTHSDCLHAGARLNWGAIVDARVQALTIVEDFDVAEHRRLRLLAGVEADLVDVLRLEGGEEALHGRIIEAVAAAAHGLVMPCRSSTMR